jgi:predicted nucleotidyltransferase
MDPQAGTGPLTPGSPVRVSLQKHRPPDVEYPAVVRDDDGAQVVVRAPWGEQDPRDLGFVRFEPGDVFTEHYWRDRWYSVKEVRDRYGALKGWYCDVARPVRTREGLLVSGDLDLDLWVSADRRTILRLDEDDFASSGLADRDPAAAAHARRALAELERLAHNGFSDILVAALVRAALLPHPAVRAVELAGSRAAGRATALSDWDFRVEVDDFRTVAADLPGLVAELRPLARQWDRLSPDHCYMLVLTGPAKVDLLLGGQPHQPEPPWTVGPDTLVGIDAHFWDWTLWLASKQHAGNHGLVGRELATMHHHLLGPMGVPRPPASIQAAVEAYRRARDRLEARFGVTVPRDLEREVLRVLPAHRSGSSATSNG